MTISRAKRTFKMAHVTTGATSGNVGCLDVPSTSSAITTLRCARSTMEMAGAAASTARRRMGQAAAASAVLYRSICLTTSILMMKGHSRSARASSSV